MDSKCLKLYLQVLLLDQVICYIFLQREVIFEHTMYLGLLYFAAVFVTAYFLVLVGCFIFSVCKLCSPLFKVELLPMYIKKKKNVSVDKYWGAHISRLKQGIICIYMREILYFVLKSYIRGTKLFSKLIFIPFLFYLSSL